MKHTQGPWKVRNERDVVLNYADGRHQKNGVEIDIQSDPGNVHIVSIKKADSLKAKAIADAHLIAAAPDLLGALQEVIRHGLNENIDGYEATLKTVWSAINKAQGI